jgi:hypothetical protein
MMGYFNNRDNELLNKNKKNYRHIFYTYRLTVFQVLCNFIIVW